MIWISILVIIIFWSIGFGIQLFGDAIHLLWLVILVLLFAEFVKHQRREQ